MGQLDHGELVHSSPIGILLWEFRRLLPDDLPVERLAGKERHDR